MRRDDRFHGSAQWWDITGPEIAVREGILALRIVRQVLDLKDDLDDTGHGVENGDDQLHLVSSPGFYIPNAGVGGAAGRPLTAWPPPTVQRNDDHDAYVPRNMPAIGDFFDLFVDHHGDGDHHDVEHKDAIAIDSDGGVVA